ncbi:MAG TPA: RraA family protein [Xanthobacteraceae bacterium]|nr:RraA family protein [Xanthobacteraceae bacterium]
MPDKKLTGRIAADRIRMQSTPKPPGGAVDRFLALGECTSLISDVMDELGIPEGVIGATTLKPTLPGKLIVGPALTVRNIRQRSDPLAAKTHVNRMAEFEAHNLAEDGDVLVISGVAGVSNMGGISSMTGQRQGERGAIVIGGVRDVRHSRAIGYPIWASEITPVTGKWRLETVEINGEIEIDGVRVNPGDLVVADDTGVCFIPRADIMRVLELCEKKKRDEDTRMDAIAEGVPVPVFYAKG